MTIYGISDFNLLPNRTCRWKFLSDVEYHAEIAMEYRWNLKRKASLPKREEVSEGIVELGAQAEFGMPIGDELVDGGAAAPADKIALRRYSGRIDSGQIQSE